MKSISDLIKRLKKLGIRIKLEGEKLSIDAPKGVITAEIKDELIKNKYRIIEFLGSVKQQSVVTVSSLQKFENKKFVPLSYSQQRIWFLEQLTPGLPVYNMPLAFSIKGNLNLENLKQSIEKIIERHEILRTKFVVKEGIPFQELFDFSLKLELIDLSNKEKFLKSQELKKLLFKEAKQTFTLDTGPLLKVSVCTLGKAEFTIFLMFHHLVFDGWSINIFLKELSEIYSALTYGKIFTKELSIQYSDFTLWQRGEQYGKIIQQQIPYWKNVLKGNLQPLELPNDFNRPTIQQYEGAIELFTVSEDILKRLNLISTRKSISIFMILLAALKVFIHKYSSQKDICIGTLVANRQIPELENLIGFFAN
ncbi:MAG: condensation domain-containing protein, partial [Ignavibacteriaceae bacterium]|nr:condensation domain-containing protein [Ignavibacteriaceae bacterium]